MHIKLYRNDSNDSNGHFSVGFEDWPNFFLHYFGLENLNVVDICSLTDSSKIVAIVF